jgi:hypothetical protein
MMKLRNFCSAYSIMRHASAYAKNKRPSADFGIDRDWPKNRLRISTIDDECGRRMMKLRNFSSASSIMHHASAYAKNKRPSADFGIDRDWKTTSVISSTFRPLLYNEQKIKVSEFRTFIPQTPIVYWVINRGGFLGGRLPFWAWAPIFEPRKAPKLNLNLGLHAR